MAKRRIFGWTLLALFVVAGVGALLSFNWIKRETAPTSAGPSYYVRYRDQKPFLAVLADLQDKGVIRNIQAMKYYAMWKHAVAAVPVGTYQFHPGMSADQVLNAMKHPISQMVRIPETNFSFRTARWLAKHDVTPADDYNYLIQHPEEFKADVSFPLPAHSLEGYLYPDTYDLPPLMGAHDTIVRQLQAFETKVWPLIKDVNDKNKVLTIASMVEMEAAKDKDRPLIAGVIVNRMNKGMKLQIDATVLYGLKQWRRLTFADYTNTISDYNTYLHPGLPPGPICSPSLKSVEAALYPTKHNYIYYVALPTGYHLFAATYAEHEANIAKRKRALAAMHTQLAQRSSPTAKV